MKWELDKGRPISPQICERVCVGIALGEFKAGERLLSVRELALDAGVNPNTVQKSFDILEQKGILYSHRGSGWFVSEDVSPAKETLLAILRDKTAEYFSAMSSLGMSVEETKKYVSEWNADQNS